MLSKLGVHVRRNVVAYLALFVALGGTAVAARPLITGTDIQDGSLTGADVENNSLTGFDVLESSLSGSAPDLGIGASNITGTITDAQVSDTLTASSAANADKLDGKDSTDFLPATTLITHTFTFAGGTITGHECFQFTVAVSGGSVGDPVFVSSSYPSNIVLTASPAVDAFGTGALFSRVQVCNPTDSNVSTNGPTVKLVLVHS
jgi:hypothetical protein